VAFAHGGGSFPATLGRIQHGFECRPDLTAIDNPKPPASYLGKFYLDSLVHDADMLRFIIKRMGVNRIALGSDYPFPLGESEPGALIRSQNFTEEEKEWMLHRSALAWLNEDIHKFL
jgi:aminocarboxymuconate-semialdehyde decarboxylase